MYDFLKKYSGGFYLGASLTAVAGINYSQIGFWVIVVPTVVLFLWKEW